MYEVTIYPNDFKFCESTEIVIKSKSFADISAILEAIKIEYPYAETILTNVVIEKEK